jgi:hypothetical protein
MTAGFVIGALAILGSSSSALAAPPSCRGEAAASFVRPGDAPTAGWLPASLDAIPAGTQLVWKTYKTQSDIRRRNAPTKLFRMQNTSQVGANENGWTCADVNQSSPWFSEKGSAPVALAFGQGLIASRSQDFWLKKRESLFAWEVRIDFKMQPSDLISSGETGLLADLKTTWDQVAVWENSQIPGNYRLILERTRPVKTEHDVNLLMVVDFEPARK